MDEAEQYPWTRRPNETPPAFEAFSVYRDLGATRSIRTVGEALGKSAQLLERWSSTHHWVDRVRAFDGQRDAEHLDVTAAQEQELLSRLLDSAELMRHRAHQALAAADEISPALAVRMLEAAAKILAARRSLKDATPTPDAEIIDKILDAVARRAEG